MTAKKPKTVKARAQYLLSPRLVETIKIRAAKENVLPNRLVERILTEGLKRTPEPEPVSA